MGLRNNKVKEATSAGRRSSALSLEDSDDDSKLVEFNGGVFKVKTGCCGLDPTTGRGKQIHLAQMLCLPFIPIMALIIQNAVNMISVLQYQYEMQETISQNLIRAIEHLGISMVFGEEYFGRGDLDHNSYLSFVTNDALGQDFLNASKSFAYWIKDRLVGSSNSHVVVGIALLVVVLIISPVIIILVRKVTRTLQAFTETLQYKTYELRYEKKRSDMLLYQMLPPTVAQQLKQRKQVSAETYESVTIYFSDIVGFTEMASESTPMQVSKMARLEAALTVISLLNALYRMFDSRIELYDVYKIETIGDAYMVASGVPQRSQGKDHAAEVASMALDLLHATENFVVPHMPGERLQIRIGIHTGPVVAGVVGTKMPRYTLFGETVNITSKMEATGLPFKIHITAATKEALDRAGGFIMKLRGEMEIRVHFNKDSSVGGAMETFWLIGKHGKLPDRRVDSDKEEVIDVMAENPHTNALRKERQKQKEQASQKQSTLSRAMESIKGHLTG
ncbi:Atrial natriuretic peptide receptor 1 [Amphibalanus amphitrite]|uniref:guanylate cyclase n=1 Tax=Amphibalanus amphitrite TaxID=1232801 RepID=A0A6A4WKG6_AMPAM|nr:Atrial natriuretic peptide receptor 1 [Amphibalanus amphitrite]